MACKDSSLLFLDSTSFSKVSDNFKEVQEVSLFLLGLAHVGGLDEDISDELNCLWDRMNIGVQCSFRGRGEDVVSRSWSEEEVSRSRRSLLLARQWCWSFPWENVGVLEIGQDASLRWEIGYLQRV